MFVVLKVQKINYLVVKILFVIKPFIFLFILELY